MVLTSVLFSLYKCNVFLVSLLRVLKCCVRCGMLYLGVPQVCVLF